MTVKNTLLYCLKSLLFWISSHLQLNIISLTKLFLPENLNLNLQFSGLDVWDWKPETCARRRYQFGAPSALKVISYAGLHAGTLTWSQTFVKAVLPQSHKFDAVGRQGMLGRPEDGPISGQVCSKLYGPSPASSCPAVPVAVTTTQTPKWQVFQFSRITRNLDFQVKLLES